MENSTFALGNTLLSRSTSPEPLSDTICPLMLNDVPATGFAAMLSTTKKVNERTVMLVKLAVVERRSVEPFNVNWTTINPNWWS